METAWDILHKAFGDPTRIIKHKKQALRSLGRCPASEIKGTNNYKEVVSWLVQLESLLLDIITLGKNNSEFEDAAFSREFSNEILGLCPEMLRLDLAKCKGSKDVLLENYKLEISAYREVQQTLANRVTEPPKTHRQEGKQSQKSGLSATPAFKPPRTYNDCRVCQTLEKDGDTDNIYENHIHNYPTGCPRYVKMNIQQRIDICRKSKICMKCHDPSYFEGSIYTALQGQPVAYLLDPIRATMPQDRPGSLKARHTAALIAWIMSLNGIAPSDAELPEDYERLASMILPEV